MGMSTDSEARLVLSPSTIDVNKGRAKSFMGTIISKGTFFRFEEIAVPSPEWEEYCSQYASHGNPAPEPFEDDIVHVIYFRQTMMGGYILNNRHMRYQSYIHESDKAAIQKFLNVVWDDESCHSKQVVSVNCLWRRKNSGFIGRLATMVMYIAIGNHARFKSCSILAGAASRKLRRLYHSWNPLQSFQYKYHDGSTRELFVFHTESTANALYSAVRSIILLKWARSSKAPEVACETESEERIAA